MFCPLTRFSPITFYSITNFNRPLRLIIVQPINLFRLLIAHFYRVWFFDTLHSSICYLHPTQLVFKIPLHHLCVSCVPQLGFVLLLILSMIYFQIWINVPITLFCSCYVYSSDYYFHDIWSRSCMGLRLVWVEGFNGFKLFLFHRNVPITFDKILDLASQKSRKLDIILWYEIKFGHFTECRGNGLTKK